MHVGALGDYRSVGRMKAVFRGHVDCWEVVIYIYIYILYYFYNKIHIIRQYICQPNPYTV